MLTLKRADVSTMKMKGRNEITHINATATTSLMASKVVSCFRTNVASMDRANAEELEERGNEGL